MPIAAMQLNAPHRRSDTLMCTNSRAFPYHRTTGLQSIWSGAAKKGNQLSNLATISHTHTRANLNGPRLRQQGKHIDIPCIQEHGYFRCGTAHKNTSTQPPYTIQTLQNCVKRSPFLKKYWEVSFMVPLSTTQVSTWFCWIIASSSSNHLHAFGANATVRVKLGGMIYMYRPGCAPSYMYELTVLQVASLWAVQLYSCTTRYL